MSTSSHDKSVRTLAAQAVGILTDAVHVANAQALASMSAFGLVAWFTGSVRALGNANADGMGMLSEYLLMFGFADDTG